jgi:phenylacetate-CoA ligase
LLSWNDIYVNEVATRGPISITSPSKPGDMVVIALPYEMSSAGMAIHKTYQYAARAAAVNVGKGGFYSNPLKTLYAMRDVGANVVFTTPSYAVALYETARAYGIVLREYVRPKILWLTGEGCSDNLRARIGELWGCEVLRFYGSLECGALGAECPMHAGFHVLASQVYVEIIDPKTGKVLPDGMVGEVCATVLNKTGQPLIRYRTEDLGYLLDEDCGCCSNLPRLILRGRKQFEIELATGRFSPILVENVLFAIPGVGNDYRLIVRKKRLSVNVTVQSRELNTPQMAERIHRRLECYVGDVEAVQIVEAIPASGGKLNRVEIES